MKIQYVFLVVIVSLSLSGCANRKETMVESTTDQTQKRVHTQEELRKTGQSETGPALEKSDAAVRMSDRP
jgi:type IV pilus biogenesis protein CpaD/CtpE